MSALVEAHFQSETVGYLFLTENVFCTEAVNVSATENEFLIFL